MILIDLGCPGLMDPDNGDVDVVSYTFGSQVTYTCFHGYVLEGEAVSECLPNGRWSGETPYCRSKVKNLKGLVRWPVHLDIERD